MHNELFHCRVCGLKLDEPPWGEDGATPSFEICPCCGVEFGYEDSTHASTEAYRDRWLAGGARWAMPRFKPANWNLEEQLTHVPEEYRSSHT